MAKWVMGVVLSALLAPGMASAQCGTFTGDSGNNTILIGWIQPKIRVTPGTAGACYHQRLGVVWRTAAGNWVHAEIGESCMPGSGGYAVIDGGGGNDTIVVYREGAENLTNSHDSGPYDTDLGWKFTPIDYPSTGVPMLVIRGGTGTDTLVGGDGPDSLHANNSARTGDSAADTLCGGNGGDYLYGDYDGTFSGSRDCLFGGTLVDPGYDWCDSGDAYTPDYDAHDAGCDVVSPTGGSSLMLSGHACLGRCPARLYDYGTGWENRADPCPEEED